jgi:hypothetical protein
LLLSAIAGHSLCLGVFGMPSDEEVRAGAVLHGEAGVRPWKPEIATHADSAEMRFEVRLPRSGLVFRRTLSLERNESVVRVCETVTNLFPTDQFIQWQQHATLGPPYLDRYESSITMPGLKGVTDPNGYEGCELLASDAEFDWPSAPAARGGSIDLRQSFPAPGTGFVAGVQIDPHRDFGFVCAVNRKRRVAFGYLFARRDFPWVAIWEENLARKEPPWNGREQARAFEFGVSPLPLGREKTLQRGNLFGTPTMLRLPAKAEISANYAMFLAHLPVAALPVGDVVCTESSIQLLTESGEPMGSVPASNIRNFVTKPESTLEPTNFSPGVHHALNPRFPCIQLPETARRSMAANPKPDPNDADPADSDSCNSPIDPKAPAGSKTSLGAKSDCNGRPNTDDSVVEAMDEVGPLKNPPNDIEGRG